MVTRAGADGLEVLAVHRPRYDDWSLPKGKLEPGESPPDAARREVAEETGIVAELATPFRPANTSIATAARRSCTGGG